MHSFTSDVQMIHSKAGTILEKITWVAEGWGFGGLGGGHWWEYYINRQSYWGKYGSETVWF